MKMTIDEIIKYLPSPICGDTVIGEEKQKEYDAHDSAVIILRKYQKIVEIVKFGNVNELGFEYIGEKITEVVEDGQ